MPLPGKNLARRGIRKLFLRGYPFAYDPAGAATLAETLRQRGYRVVVAEQNYHLDPAREQPSALGAAHERSHAPAVGKKLPRGVAPDESRPTGEKDGLHRHHGTEC